MIYIFRYFIVTIVLFGRRKQIEPNRDKTVTIRPTQCKQSKSLLKFMFYMIVNTRKQFYRFTSIPLYYRIIQYLYPFWSGKSIKSGSNFSCKEQKKLAPVIGSFIEKTNMYSLKQPDLYVWSSENERDFVPWNTSSNKN